MVGGQSVDLALATGAGANNNQDYESESVRSLKTSALMRLALRTGAILAGANYSNSRSFRASPNCSAMPTSFPTT
jgi:geranylgeranyl pyrophosphate synthase